MTRHHRDVSAMNVPKDADHSRTLVDSTVVPQVAIALRDWLHAQPHGDLIGGLALSYHVRPRATQDIDFLVLDEIPTTVPGFKRFHPGSFVHEGTHVEVNVVTPHDMNVPASIAAEVSQSARECDGARVASESGLVALKLFRLSLQDKADIVALIKTGRVNMDRFSLPPALEKAFRELVLVAASDPHP